MSTLNGSSLSSNASHGLARGSLIKVEGRSRSRSRPRSENGHAPGRGLNRPRRHHAAVP
jgi:hypothetical protein